MFSCNKGEGEASGVEGGAVVPDAGEAITGVLKASCKTYVGVITKSAFGWSIYWTKIDIRKVSGSTTASGSGWCQNVDV